MIVLHNSIFGYIKIIVFQLALWIGIIKTVGKSCCGTKVNMLAFSYSAVPSRHEISIKPTEREDITFEKMNAQNSKTSFCRRRITTYRSCAICDSLRYLKALKQQNRIWIFSSVGRVFGC